jgi:hypothetical protein
MADTTTTNYTFVKPEHLTAGWDVKINSNLDLIDTAIKANSLLDVNGDVYLSATQQFYLDDHICTPETLEGDTIRIFCIRNRCKGANRDTVNGCVYTLLEVQAPAEYLGDGEVGDTVASSEATLTLKLPDKGVFADLSCMTYGDGTTLGDSSAGLSFNFQNRTGDATKWANIFFTYKKQAFTRRVLDIAYNGSIGFGGCWQIQDWGNDVAIQTLQSAFVLARGYNTVAMHSNVYRQAGTTAFLHNQSSEHAGRAFIEDGVFYVKVADGTGKNIGDAISWSGASLIVGVLGFGFYGAVHEQYAALTDATNAGETMVLVNSINGILKGYGLTAAS